MTTALKVNLFWTFVFIVSASILVTLIDAATALNVMDWNWVWGVFFGAALVFGFRRIDKKYPTE